MDTVALRDNVNTIAWRLGFGLLVAVMQVDSSVKSACVFSYSPCFGL